MKRRRHRDRDSEKEREREWTPYIERRLFIKLKDCHTVQRTIKLKLQLERCVTDVAVKLCIPHSYYDDMSYTIQKKGKQTDRTAGRLRL